MIIERTKTGFVAFQRTLGKRTKVGFIAEGITALEARNGVISLIAEHCTKTGERPSMLLQSTVVHS